MDASRCHLGGGALRLYVNGTQVGQLLYTGSITTSNAVLRIGGNSVRAEWFQGLIDEVRIYNRALSAAEVQSDLTRSVGVVDTTPPSAPANLAGTGSTSSVLLNWNASSDAVGVAHYNVHRSNAPDFTPAAVNRIAQPTGLSYTDTGLSSGFYYYKVTPRTPQATSAPPRTSSGSSSPATPNPDAAEQLRHDHHHEDLDCDGLVGVVG